MPRMGIAARLFVDRQAVVHVAPILRRCIGGIDAKRFDGINGLQNSFDCWPSSQAQENLSAGTHVGHGGAWLALRYRAQNIDARDGGAVVVSCPSDESKQAAWGERDDTAITVEDGFLSDSTEPDPVLDALLEPYEFNLGKITHAQLRRS